MAQVAFKEPNDMLPKDRNLIDIDEDLWLLENKFQTLQSRVYLMLFFLQFTIVISVIALGMCIELYLK